MWFILDYVYFITVAVLNLINFESLVKKLKLVCAKKYSTETISET